MTTLYKPVLIESAEQAEALPVGTVALDGSPDGRTVASRLPGPGRLLLGWITSDGLESFAGMVGWTALVPTEAEDEPAMNRINITHMSPPAPQQVPVLLPCPRCGLR